MGGIKALLRIYSYVFGGLLALFVLALAAMSISSGVPLNLAFLPWNGASLTYWLAGLALLGLFSVVMAAGGQLRLLFFLWTLAVFLLLFKGLFVSFYSFTGPVSFAVAARLTLAALVAAVGAYPWKRVSTRVRKPQLY